VTPAPESPWRGCYGGATPVSNTAADHLTVLDEALAQIPAHLRQPDTDGKVKVLVATDAAGPPTRFTARIAGLGMEFSSALTCTTSITNGSIHRCLPA